MNSAEPRVWFMRARATCRIVQPTVVAVCVPCACPRLSTSWFHCRRLTLGRGAQEAGLLPASCRSAALTVGRTSAAILAVKSWCSTGHLGSGIG